jgi:hypothetical protein
MLSESGSQKKLVSGMGKSHCTRATSGKRLLRLLFKLGHCRGPLLSARLNVQQSLRHQGIAHGAAIDSRLGIMRKWILER